MRDAVQRIRTEGGIVEVIVGRGGTGRQAPDDLQSADPKKTNRCILSLFFFSQVVENVMFRSKIAHRSPKNAGEEGFSTGRYVHW